MAAAFTTNTPTPISSAEPLTRFVLDPKHLRPGTTQVYWRAFRPKPSDDELSVARVEALSDEQIWTLGNDVAAAPGGRVLVGRADFLKAAVHNARAAVPTLEVVPDEPPVRHASIIGWPTGDENARKAAAMILAAESRQVVRAPASVIVGFSPSTVALCTGTRAGRAGIRRLTHLPTRPTSPTRPTRIATP